MCVRACVCVHVCVCVRACVRACVWIEQVRSMHYVGISTYQLISYYASAIHKHTHTRTLKPFEDSEPTGLKVNTAQLPHNKQRLEAEGDSSSDRKTWQVYCFGEEQKNVFRLDLKECRGGFLSKRKREVIHVEELLHEVRWHSNSTCNTK